MSPDVAHWVVRRAAADMILAAGGTLKRAASPDQADVPEAKSTAAGGACFAGVGRITGNIRGDRGRRWCWRSWRRLGRVWALLSGVRCHHSNSTLASGGVDVALHADVPSLTPLWTP